MFGTDVLKKQKAVVPLAVWNAYSESTFNDKVTMTITNMRGENVSSNTGSLTTSVLKGECQ